MGAKSHWQNGAAQRCKELGCTDRDCDPTTRTHQFHVRGQHERRRFRGPVTKFAHLWLPVGKMPVTQKQAETLASRLVDRLRAGLSLEAPTPAPTTMVTMVAAVAEKTVNDMIDGYQRWKRLEALKRKKKTSKGHISKTKVIRQAFGAMTLTAFEKHGADRMTDFVLGYVAAGKKASSAFTNIGAVLKPAAKWAYGKDDPWLTRDVFKKYAFHVDMSYTPRDKRVAPEFEAQLYAALTAFGQGTRRRRYRCWPTVLKFIECGIDLVARKEELLDLNNRDVDWHRHVVVLRDTKYQGETRLVPFNPDGRVGLFFQSRRFAGPDAPIFVGVHGRRLSVTTLHWTWVIAVCGAEGIPVGFDKRGLPDQATRARYKELRQVIHSLRHEGNTWLAWCKVPQEVREFMLGHRRQSINGLYQHDQLRLLQRYLRDDVWPKEHERGRKEVVQMLTMASES